MITFRASPPYRALPVVSSSLARSLFLGHNRLLSAIPQTTGTLLSETREQATGKAWLSSTATPTPKNPVAPVARKKKDATMPVADFLKGFGAEAPVDDSKPPAAGPDGFPPPKSTIPNPFRDLSKYSGNTSQSGIGNAIKPAVVYKLHVHSTRNNTITTLTTHDGKPTAWYSGGSCGFKKNNRASYEAGYQCAVRMFQKVKDIMGLTPVKLELYFKGFGQGRDALFKALSTSEGDAIRPLLIRMTDRTPIKIGGTRAKKTRRL